MKVHPGLVNEERMVGYGGGEILIQCKRVVDWSGGELAAKAQQFVDIRIEIQSEPVAHTDVLQMLKWRIRWLGRGPQGSIESKPEIAAKPKGTNPCDAFLDLLHSVFEGWLLV